MKDDFLCKFFKFNLNHTRAIALQHKVIQCPTDSNVGGYTMFDTIKKGDLLFFHKDAEITDLAVATSDCYISDINCHDRMYAFLDSKQWRTVEFKLLNQGLLAFDHIEEFLFNRTFRSSNFCAKLHPKNREGFRKCIEGYIASNAPSSTNEEIKGDAWLPSSYVWEKAYCALDSLSTSPQSLKQRIGDAYMFHLMHLQMEELSPELKKLFSNIEERLTEEEPAGDEGSVQASLATMTDDMASEVAKDIFKLCYQVIRLSE